MAFAEGGDREQFTEGIAGHKKNTRRQDPWPAQLAARDLL
jgi:hypothetical protein